MCHAGQTGHELSDLPVRSFWVAAFALTRFTWGRRFRWANWLMAALLGWIVLMFTASPGKQKAWHWLAPFRMSSGNLAGMP